MDAKFEDLAPAMKVSPGYFCTNEEPENLHTLLKDVRVDRAAGICSGGEMAFFLLLPKVRKELVAVDHSAGQLAHCYLKALILNDLGADATKKLFTTGTVVEVTNAALKVMPQLPKPLYEALSAIQYGATEKVLTKWPGLSWQDLRREWHYGPARALRAAARKLDRITFCHGDLRDIQPKGPFDLLYLSNAFEHSSRNNEKLTLDHIDPLIHDKSIVLTSNAAPVNGGQSQYISGTYKPMEPPKAKWEKLKELKGYRSSWTYYTYRRAPQPVAA